MITNKNVKMKTIVVRGLQTNKQLKEKIMERNRDPIRLDRLENLFEIFSGWGEIDTNNTNMRILHSETSQAKHVTETG